MSRPRLLLQRRVLPSWQAACGAGGSPCRGLQAPPCCRRCCCRWERQTACLAQQPRALGWALQQVQPRAAEQQAAAVPLVLPVIRVPHGLQPVRRLQQAQQRGLPQVLRQGRLAVQCCPLLLLALLPELQRVQQGGRRPLRQALLPPAAAPPAAAALLPPPLLGRCQFAPGRAATQKRDAQHAQSRISTRALRSLNMAQLSTARAARTAPLPSKKPHRECLHQRVVSHAAQVRLQHALHLPCSGNISGEESEHRR